MVIVQAPPGSSLTYTTALAEQAEGIIAQNPDVGGLFSVVGFSLAGSSANAGMMFVNTSAMPGDHRKRQSTARSEERRAEAANADARSQRRSGGGF